MDVTTTYRAFVNKLDVSIRSLLDNMRVIKRANGGGSVTWAEVEVIFRDQLLGVALVSPSVIGSGNSILTENSTLGSVGLASSNGGTTFTKQVASSNLSTFGPIQGCG